MTDNKFKLIMKKIDNLKLLLKGKCNVQSDGVRYLRKRLHELETQLIQDIHDNDLEYLPK